MKNKRKHHYRHGWLDVPEKYAYLKHNAGKRNPAASRKKAALRVTSSRTQLEGVGGHMIGPRDVREGAGLNGMVGDT